MTDSSEPFEHRPSATRARDLGIPFDGVPGRWNSITDVPGVEVGHVTLIDGAGTHVRGVGPIRTGVTAVLPNGRDGVGRTVPAGWHALNGNGEMTGIHWITETGGLSTPVMITNTHAVGPVHRGVVDWVVTHRPELAAQWLLPVVAETWDGYLNDINGDHVTSEHAVAAIDAACTGPVAEGSVGGGTGMNCYGFKGGAGTASRLVTVDGAAYTVGAYVQANFGSRDELRIAGTYLGDIDCPNPLGDGEWFAADLGGVGGSSRATAPAGSGSVIVLIATDAPLLPAQCSALARRVPLGLARTGTTGSHFSGDLFLAWSTANDGALCSAFPVDEPGEPVLHRLSFIPWGRVDGLYTAVVQTVEEAVCNALVSNQDMTGRNNHLSPALPHDLVRARFAGLRPSAADLGA